MGGCSSSITHREINISTKEVLNLGHAQELWGETSWYHTETADHEWKKITSKLSASPTFHTEGTATNYIPKQVREGRKAFQNILLENLPGMIFSSSLYRWALATPPSPLFLASFCESLLWWDSDRSKAIGYKCGTRTDLNPSHTHCVSFYSWKFPGKWNRTFQLYIVYIGPFKKGENLEHSQKLYIKLKKKLIPLFASSQLSKASQRGSHPGTLEQILVCSSTTVWRYDFLTPGGPGSTWMLLFTSAALMLQNLLQLGGKQGWWQRAERKLQSCCCVSTFIHTGQKSVP